MRFSPHGPAFGGALAAAAIIALASPRARADADPDVAAAAVAVPGTELRLVAGLDVGAEAAASLIGHRLRLEAGVHGWRNRAFGEAAVLARVLGAPANGLWLRGGYLYQRVDVGCPMIDRASAWDASVAYRRRWAGGSLFFAETGVERVSRAGSFDCNDSVLAADSVGARVVVGGQYALTRWLGLYGRLGARTGQHLVEIGVLPELWAGFAFEL